MDVPLTTGLHDISAPYSDRTNQEIIKLANGILPVFQSTNKSINSLDIDEAVQVTNEEELFKGDDFKKAYQLWNPLVQYPFDELALIENYQFHTNYFDGTEGRPINKVTENLIGTALGATPFDDPRHIFVDTIMKHHEYANVNDPLDTDYIRELYMLNTEKGNNYYKLQLEKQLEGMDQFARARRWARNKPLPNIYFTARIPMGDPNREPTNNSKVPFYFFNDALYTNTRTQKYNLRESSNPYSSKINEDLRAVVNNPNKFGSTILENYADKMTTSIGLKRDLQSELRNLNDDIRRSVSSKQNIDQKNEEKINIFSTPDVKNIVKNGTGSLKKSGGNYLNVSKITPEYLKYRQQLEGARAQLKRYEENPNYYSPFRMSKTKNFVAEHESNKQSNVITRKGGKRFRK